MPAAWWAFFFLLLNVFVPKNIVGHWMESNVSHSHRRGQFYMHKSISDFFCVGVMYFLGKTCPNRISKVFKLVALFLAYLYVHLWIWCVAMQKNENLIYIRHAFQRLHFMCIFTYVTLYLPAISFSQFFFVSYILIAKIIPNIYIYIITMRSIPNIRHHSFRCDSQTKKCRSDLKKRNVLKSYEIVILVILVAPNNE